MLECPIYTYNTRSGKLTRRRWLTLDLTRDVPRPQTTDAIDVVSFSSLKNYIAHLARVHANTARALAANKTDLAGVAEAQRAKAKASRPRLMQEIRPEPFSVGDDSDV